MLFLKNQSIQFLKALRIKQLQDFCFLKYIMGLITSLQTVNLHFFDLSPLFVVSAAFHLYAGLP